MDRAYRAMVSHELEHRRHAHDAAGQLADALSALPAVDGPCNGLEASVKRQVRLAADAASRQSRGYDLATDLGALIASIPEPCPCRGPACLRRCRE